MVVGTMESTKKIDTQGQNIGILEALRQFYDATTLEQAKEKVVGMDVKCDNQAVPHEELDSFEAGPASIVTVYPEAVSKGGIRGAD